MATIEINPVCTIQSSDKQGIQPKTRRQSIIREFALNTSTHALPGIARSQSIHNRLFWTISFLFFTGVMIFFIVQSITSYFQYQTQTTIAIVVERDQLFPAVTICNYCPGRFDRIIGPFLNYTNSRNITNTTDMSNFPPEIAYYLRDFMIYLINSEAKFEHLFFSLKDMLISCTYNGETCDTSDFISFFSTTFGICHTFNARLRNTSTDSLRRINDNSGSGKLKLQFYVHNHLYIPWILSGVSSGMVAMLHDSSEVPLVDVAGIELAPGRKHRLAYQKKSSYFLSYPYTDCVSTASDVMQDVFKRYGGANYEYSQTVCYAICSQAYVYKKCGCVSHLQWLARSVKLENTSEIIEASVCKLSDPCFENATNELSQSQVLWNQYCSHCSQQCSIITYMVTPSSVSAPDLQYSMLTKAFVEQSDVPLPTGWLDNWSTSIQNNYIGLDVVCQTTLVENYTQEPSMTPVDVLSNVGGQTGLWIGISFLSVMEIIEMLYRLSRNELCLLFRRIKTRVPPEWIF